MVSDPVRTQVDDIQKHDVTQCERTSVAKFTKTRVHYYLIPRALLIGVILVGTLLTPLLFPTLLSFGAPIVLTAASSSSQVEMGGPFTKTSALMSNELATSGSDIKIQQSTSSQTPIAATMTDVDRAYYYATGESFNGVYWHKVVHEGNNFFKASESNVGTIAVGNVPTPATGLQQPELVKNDTTLTISAPTTILNGSNFVVSGKLYRTCFSFPVPLTFQLIGLYDSSTNQRIATVTTDSQGSYSFPLQENLKGTYTYYVRYAGTITDKPRTSEDVTINVLHLNALNTGLFIFAPQTVLQGADFTLSGYLKQTSSGNPVSNPQINLYDSSTNQRIATVTTDSQGYYSFPLQENSPGTYSYYASFEGNNQVKPFRSENVTVEVSGQEPTYLYIFGPFDVVYQGKNFTLSGSLQQACGEGQLSDYTIVLYKNNLTVNNQKIGSTQTDSLGYYNFTVQESSQGKYDYYVRFEGNPQFAPFRSENVTVNVRP